MSSSRQISTFESLITTSVMRTITRRLRNINISISSDDESSEDSSCYKEEASKYARKRSSEPFKTPIFKKKSLKKDFK